MNSLKERITIIALLVVGKDGMLPVMKLIETLFNNDSRNSRALIGEFSLSISGHMNL